MSKALLKEMNEIDYDAYHYSLNHTSNIRTPVDTEPHFKHELNHLFNELLKNYGENHVNKTLMKMNIMPYQEAEKLIPKFQKKYAHNNRTDFSTDEGFDLQKDKYVYLNTYDGSLVAFNSIKLYDVRTIINLFRIGSTPFTKVQAERQTIMDLLLNSSQLHFTNSEDYYSTGDSDFYTRKMDNMEILNGYGQGLNNLIPAIQQLKKLAKSSANCFLLKSCKRSHSSDNLDYPYIIQDRFSPMSKQFIKKRLKPQLDNKYQGKPLSKRDSATQQTINSLIPKLTVNTSASIEGVNNNGSGNIDLEKLLRSNSERVMSTINSLVHIVNGVPEHPDSHNDNEGSHVTKSLAERLYNYMVKTGYKHEAKNALLICNDPNETHYAFMNTPFINPRWNEAITLSVYLKHHQLIISDDGETLNGFDNDFPKGFFKRLHDYLIFFGVSKSKNKLFVKVDFKEFYQKKASLLQLMMLIDNRWLH